jgi:S1-C subfamily serine protease
MISALLKLSLQFLLITEVSSFAFPMAFPNMHSDSKQFCPCVMKMERRDMILKSLLLATTITPLISGSQIAKSYNTDELHNINIYEKCSPSVCYISTEYKNIASELKMSDTDIKNMPKGVGTGFVWDTNGHIVTNFHVINKADKADVTLLDSKGAMNVYTAKLTGVDPDRDIAVLKIDANTLIPITIGSDQDVKVGQHAYAIGNPFGQDHTFTMGIISGKNREISSPTGRKIKSVLQTDAAINPGNSGGPLLDSSANLIGMNTATFGLGVSSGVNFAISIDMVKESVSEIIQYGMVQRAVLGISYVEKLPIELTKDGPVNKGVIVSDVPKTSPAFASGLRGIDKDAKKLGDVIIAIDDNTINNSVDMLSTLDKYKPGQKIKLHVLRCNKTPIVLDVVLSSFRVHTFSGLQYENELSNTSLSIPLDVPLDNIAPEMN